MASDTDYQEHPQHLPRGQRPGRGSRPIISTAASVAVLALVLLAAGCGGSKSPGAGGRRSASSVSLAKFEAYATCVRSLGSRTFPTPPRAPAGVSRSRSTAARGATSVATIRRSWRPTKACRGLMPGGGQAPAPLSAQKIAAEGGVGPLHALARPPGLPGPEQPRRVRQQQVRRNLARVSGRKYRMPVGATERADARRARKRLGMLARSRAGSRDQSISPRMSSAVMPLAKRSPSSMTPRKSAAFRWARATTFSSMVSRASRR